jgi:hypothetical protein
MDETRPRTDTESARDLRRRRRAKRAFVANYIRELSGRRDTRRQNGRPPEQLAEQPQGG